VSESTRHSFVDPNFTKKQQIPPISMSDCVSSIECDRNRSTCVALNDAKLKSAVLGTKLWVVIAAIMFLCTSGTSIVCTARNAGQAEEKINSLNDKFDSMNTQLGVLRQEIWDALGIHHPSTAIKSDPLVPTTSIITPSTAVTNASTINTDTNDDNKQ